MHFISACCNKNMQALHCSCGRLKVLSVHTDRQDMYPRQRPPLRPPLLARAQAFAFPVFPYQSYVTVYPPNILVFNTIANLIGKTSGDYPIFARGEPKYQIYRSTFLPWLWISNQPKRCTSTIQRHISLLYSVMRRKEHSTHDRRIVFCERWNTDEAI